MPVHDEWSIRVWWRPPLTTHSSQLVFAFAKSTVGSQGLLLVTATGEIGVWDDGRFWASSFPWHSLFLDGAFHELEAIGANGSTSFFADGVYVAKVAAQPRHLKVGRIGGDVDCGKWCPPQGVGELKDFQLYGFASLKRL